MLSLVMCLLTHHVDAQRLELAAAGVFEVHRGIAPRQLREIVEVNDVGEPASTHISVSE